MAATAPALYKNAAASWDAPCFEVDTMLRRITSLACTLFLAAVSASSSTRAPLVRLDDATVIGFTEGPSTSFLGIPFAQPPIGKLRLQLPQPIARYTGVINATTFGNQCIQQITTQPTFPPGLPPEIPPFVASLAELVDVPQSEDCLNINVIVPAGTRPGDGFPVAAVSTMLYGRSFHEDFHPTANLQWIYGGGFQVGSNAVRPGAVIVNRSIELGAPVIFVSMNYRLNAFGFLGGREIQKAGLGNLGLHDQREALRWVQKHISAFGGDPSKVTIWGQSAGSHSVALQMITNGGDTEGLFRAGWMESGSAPPTGSILKLQPTFDYIVLETGSTHPRRQRRKHSLRDRTAAEVAAYAKSNYFPNASDATIARLLELYPGNPAAGSPFGTGDQFAFTPEYKRLAAFQGDFMFQATRRFFLDQRAGKQVVRSFPLLGVPTHALFPARTDISPTALPDWQAHTSELANVFGGGDMTDFLVRFVNTFDPNGGPQIHWPEYSPDAPQSLAFVEGTPDLTIIADTFRKEATDFLTQLSLAEPF
uniref:Carboxylic ester hydrolase n=1 Tax=Ganoderma boninense TaxID=34458 RepID=A0A5K1K362_9APHY|nr:Putative peptide synthase/polyketide synthase [Ganoderma boninense]